MEHFINSYRELFKLPKSIWVFFFAVVVNRMGTMVLPFLTLYLTKSQGMNLKEAGVIFSIYGIISIGVAPFAGAFADRFGAFRVLCLTLLFSALMMFAYPYAHGFFMIAIFTALLSAFNEVFRPVIFTLASEFAPPEYQRQSVVLIRLGANIGMSIGPAIGGWLILHSYNAIFFMDAITTLLASFVLYYFFFYKKMGEGAHLKGTKKSPDEKSVLHNIAIASKDPIFRRFWIGLLLITTVFFQHDCTWPLIMVKNLDLSPAVYGKLFTINTLIIIFMEIPLLARISHVRSQTLFMWGALFTSVGIGAISWATNSYWIYVLTVFFTFGEIFFIPVATTYVASISPPGKKGIYMGTYLMAFNLSLVIAPLLGTFLLDHFGIYTFSAVMFLLGAASIWVFRQKVSVHFSPPV